MIASNTPSPKEIIIRILRQDAPGQAQRWEEFSIPWRANMNVISCLQYIAAHPITTDAKETTTPVWEAGCLEEVCGACTMVINGRVRQACSALVDKLGEPGAAITLEPMRKFPLVRDLMVDRSRIFNDLAKVKAWVPIDGTYDVGPGPTMSQETQEMRYPLSRCITCGCCLEACPQYRDDNDFLGAAIFSQARLFNSHPTGVALSGERLDVLMSPGGVGDCGKAGNCVEVCPKLLPNLESIADLQRQVTVHAVKKFFLGK